ncbi:sugar ABC transporter substrate-binding protein [Oceanispirochaeta sp. M1]|nr:sugar ABC transporter substrate-binding protein [Oceanispirochaeta sp. M1]
MCITVKNGYKYKGVYMKKALLIMVLITCSFSLWATGQQEKEDDTLKIGYVFSLMTHEWYQNILQGAQARADELGITLVTADANMDINRQISAAENLLAQGVDVLIITPVDAKAMAPIVKMANQAGVPVLSESNVIEGAETFVGISNFASAKTVGEWFVGYAKDNNIDPKVLIVGLPNYEDCRQRVDGFKEALEESGLNYEIKQEVDGGGDKEKSLMVSQDAMTAHPDINVIFGINDNSATGGMAAYKEAGLNESELTVIGFGFEGVVGQTALLSGSPYKASLAMFPNYVGVGCIDAAVKAAKGEALPEHYKTPTVAININNFDQFYNKDGEKYVIDFEAVRKLED